MISFSLPIRIESQRKHLFGEKRLKNYRGLDVAEKIGLINFDYAYGHHPSGFDNVIVLFKC